VGCQHRGSSFVLSGPPLSWRRAARSGRVATVAVLAAIFMAVPARVEADDAQPGLGAGVAVMSANIIVGTAASVTLIGEAVSLGTDTPKSPSRHLTGWSIANFTLGTIGLIAATLVAANVGADAWELWAPLGVISAADLGLGIAGLLHEPAKPTALSWWVPVPQIGVAPNDSLSMRLVFQGVF
jgi:hypothetical protein